MLSKKQKQFLQKLEQKKFRKEFNCFLVEGKKSISEFLKAGFVLDSLYCVSLFWEGVPQEKITRIFPEELAQISLLKNPDEGVAVFQLPKEKPLKNKGLTLVLDEVRDPGNLGTIIRLCDWFDIEQIVCSLGCVDCFNPKVVQATMGSLSRISLIYTDLKEYLSQVKVPIFATTLTGESFYQCALPKEAVLIFGNEANGISPEIMRFCTHFLTIPQFGNNTAESLNVATATAILLSEYKRVNFT